MKTILLLALLGGFVRLAAADPVLVAAHRGGYANDRADRAPENSVANVAVAIRKGFDLYETDIQRTKDGVFVVVHDETLERETTGQGRAADLTLLDLKALTKRYRDGSLSEEKVATLEELLLAGKGRIGFKADLNPASTPISMNLPASSTGSGWRKRFSSAAAGRRHSKSQRPSPPILRRSS